MDNKDNRNGSESFDNYNSGYRNYYQNSTSSQNEGEKTSGTSYSSRGSYGSGSSYSSGSSYGSGSSYEHTSTTNTKKKSGVGKKIATAMAIGLGFGLFAGAGFEAVNLTGNFIRKNLLKEDAIVASNEATENSDEISGTGQNSTPFLEEIFKGDEDKSDEAKEKIESGEDNKQAIESTKLNDAKTVTTTVTDVTEVVKAVMPSVVAVNNRSTSQVMTYFGQTYSQESESAGSGIIVGENDTELLLVTNAHVVSDADELTVTFVDDSQAKAQIKGSDEGRDLAVIAVMLDDLSKDTKDAIAIAEIGDSDNLTVGEPVIAIGNSLGYGQSVTTGVVSALNRTIAASTNSQNYYGYQTTKSDDDVAEFIQTDAAINPGNSGGALLNMYGQVIGINSNKIGGSSVEGMGYAIPISDAEPIIEELMNKETKLKVSDSSRGYLGITGVNVEKSYSEVYGMPVGVYVSSVTEGTGAEEAGLVRGDIIVAINGTSVSSMDELREELAYYASGTVVEITIMQGSPSGYQEKKVNVTLSSQ